MKFTLVHIRRLIQHVAISNWERGFLQSVLKQKFSYTEKQNELLDRMWHEYYPEPMDEIEHALLMEFTDEMWQLKLKHEILLIKLKDGELPF